MIRHVLKGKAEETECDHCGAPLYSGDTMHQNTAESSRGYCSPACAKYEASDAEHTGSPIYPPEPCPQAPCPACKLPRRMRKAGFAVWQCGNRRCARFGC